MLAHEDERRKNKISFKGGRLAVTYAIPREGRGPRRGDWIGSLWSTGHSAAYPSAHGSLRRLSQTTSGVRVALTFSALAFPGSRSHMD